MKNYWRLWCKAIGTKEGVTNREANIVAGIRTALVVLAVITELFIIYGVVTR